MISYFSNIFILSPIVYNNKSLTVIFSKAFSGCTMYDYRKYYSKFITYKTLEKTYKK